MTSDKPDITDRALLELLGDVCGLLDIDELRHGLLFALGRVLPSDFISLNDVGPTPEEIVSVVQPELARSMHDVWAEHAHENPLLARYLATGDGRAYRFSDIVTREQLHALGLYRELYGPLGVEHQLAFTLPANHNRVLAIALSRRERDYSDAECEFANRARPFLIQMYLNALSFQALRARQHTPSPTPLIETLLEAGLTQREAQVLRLVALGRSNQHVANALGISDRTVGKHLERVFRKLGVRDRSSAAGRVWELAGTGLDGSGPWHQAAVGVLEGARAGGLDEGPLKHAGFAR